MSVPHRKTCKRFDIDGDAHALTFSCFHCLPLLSKPRSCQWVIDSLQRGRELGQYDLWAYVIMPEHMHVVLWPHPGVRMKHSDYNQTFGCEECHFLDQRECS
jgi:putative transposase